MNQSIYNVLVVVFLFLWLSGCKKESDDSVLDIKLDLALISASDGIGRAHYVLPESTDYSKIPQDPTNPITKDKVELGKQLFHESLIASNPNNPVAIGTYSCASCHFAGAGFQAGRRQGIGEGGSGFGINGEGRIINPDYQEEDIDVQPIRTLSTLNTAYQKNMSWNGQFGATGLNIGTEGSWAEGTPKAANHLGFEGLETQAIAGLDVHRLQCDADLIVGGPYQRLFDAAFGEFSKPERYSNKTAALAIAAYERTLLANQAPFQQWLRGSLNALSSKEKAGAILFFGQANCYQCHNGPALNSEAFYALGLEHLSGRGIYGTANDEQHPERLGRGGFTGNPIDNYKFKVPQLYNLADSPFYGHGGTLQDLRQVVDYKNLAIPHVAVVPDLADDFLPLNLNENEVESIVAFLQTGLHDPELKRYEPASVLSGNCFPNNDLASRIDLNCN